MATNGSSSQLVDPADIDLARRVSPERFLRRHYKDVAINQRGDSIAVAKTLRADFRNGHWVSCDWHSSGIGDNIQLVRWVVGTRIRFGDAVGEMLGRAHAAAEPPRATEVRLAADARPRMPRCAGHALGRAYLESRGIAMAAIREAEAQGALSYVADGVVFVGRDWSAPRREIRSATIRYYEPHLLPNGTFGNKRDLANSDKEFPMLLAGGRSLAIVVEGGVNALAARQMAGAWHGAAPLVIASGGVGVQSWLTGNAPVRDLLAAAGTVEIWGENELDSERRPDPVKQQRTDALRLRLQAAIAGLRQGEIPEIVYPPSGLKDAAEWLLGWTGTDEDLKAPPPRAAPAEPGCGR
jgi:hypothetical protein